MGITIYQNVHMHETKILVYIPAGGGQQIFGWISFAESNSSNTNETGAGGCGGCTAARRKLPRRVPKRNFGCLKRWKASPSCTPTQFRLFETMYSFSVVYPQRNFGCFRLSALGNTTKSFLPSYTNAICRNHPL